MCEFGVYARGPASRRKVNVKRSSRCRACSRLRLLAYEHDKSAKIRAISIRAKSVPCMDCGAPYPHYVMDLDHRPEFEKVKNVSRNAFWRTRPISEFVAEIEKCDVVCANCHRERSYQREQESDAVQLVLMPSCPELIPRGA